MKPITLLLVEDHLLVREGVRKMLDLETDIVVIGEAKDGRQAVTMALELCPDVMLTDIAMPGLNGVEATRVKQVLINLLSNAIKYNQSGGAVSVECSLTPFGRRRISVKDTGAGLSPENMAQLFQPFNRLGQEAGGEEGTGIGLVVSKRLVELMHGHIGVESAVGSGSEFWIELLAEEDPHADYIQTASAGTSDSPAIMGLRSRLLLYVEDNPANLQLIEQLIARRPEMRLLTAQNGIDGIQLARVSMPDVILMDINLPGITGIEAMKILRLDPLTAHIPIVALSANAIPHDIEKGLAAGFFRYLTTPIMVNQFLETLNEVMEFAQRGGNRGEK